MNEHQVVLVPGDGIGPEVTEAVKRILAAAKAPVHWLEFQAGLTAVEQGKALLPDEVLDAIRTHRVALKGPCTTPVGEGFTSINVTMRKKLNLYAGKSSSLKSPKAQQLLRCIRRAMPSPDWGTIPHQYVRYKVNVVATYPPSDTF